MLLLNESSVKRHCISNFIVKVFQILHTIQYSIHIAHNSNLSLRFPNIAHISNSFLRFFKYCTYFKFIFKHFQIIQSISHLTFRFSFEHWREGQWVISPHVIFVGLKILDATFDIKNWFYVFMSHSIFIAHCLKMFLISKKPFTLVLKFTILL